MDIFFKTIDTVMMPVYGIMANPLPGFYLGTFALAAACLLLGELTMLAALAWNRSYLLKKTGEMVRLNNMSIEALRSGDGDSYRACNKLANDSFGQVFFMQFTLSAAALWPVPFALAWMQRHFVNIEFPLPLLSSGLGFAGMFILFYILARILFGNLKSALPFSLPGMDVMESLGLETARMKSWQELFPAPPEKMEKMGSCLEL